jgi:hypothetical protein
VQVLNVACGGTLVQDIPSQLPGALGHSLPCPPNQAYTFAHEVWIEKDSLLATLMRERLTDDALRVNSRITRRSRTSRRASRVGDGAGRRHRSDRGSGGAFCLGVQWHPENFFRTGEFRRCSRASSRRRRNRARRRRRVTASKTTFEREARKARRDSWRLFFAAFAGFAFHRFDADRRRT